MRAFWHYYRTLNLFNICFSSIVAFMAFKFYLFPLMFCTLGTIAGIFSYSYFFKNECYFYNNLGYSNLRLFTMTFVINIVLAIPVFLLTLLY